jgi:hypothetical protein
LPPVFAKAAGTYMTARVHKGVWVSDRPLVLLSGIDLDDMACFEIEGALDVLVQFEWIEEGKAFREFLVPAATLNGFPRRKLSDEELLAMPWAR